MLFFADDLSKGVHLALVFQGQHLVEVGVTHGQMALISSPYRIFI
jgi:hypothetical protein